MMMVETMTVKSVTPRKRLFWLVGKQQSTEQQIQNNRENRNKGTVEQVLTKGVSLPNLDKVLRS